MNKVLTYSQYLKRSQELKTPEDIAAFAQELIAPLMGNVAPTETVPVQEETADDAAAPQEDALAPVRAKDCQKNPN